MSARIRKMTAIRLNLDTFEYEPVEPEPTGIQPIPDTITRRNARLDKVLPGYLIGLLILVHKQFGLNLIMPERDMFKAFYKDANNLLKDFANDLDILCEAVVRAGESVMAAELKKKDKRGFSFKYVRLIAETNRKKRDEK